MHFLCLKTPQITGFLHRVSPRLPESAVKVTVSVLWVYYAWQNTVHCFFTLLHKCTPVFLGAFLVRIPFFCNFLVLNRHFYHNQRQNYGLLCLVLAFSSLAAAFLQHFSRSFPGSAEHKCSKPRKTQKKRKIRVFSRKCYLFCRKALRRVSLHLQ